MSETARTIQQLKALGDPFRLSAMYLLGEQGELCVCDIVAILAAPQPRVSRQLSQLRQAGLVTGTRRGQWHFYCLAEDLPDWVHHLLSSAEVTQLIPDTQLQTANKMTGGC